MGPREQALHPHSTHVFPPQGALQALLQVLLSSHAPRNSAFLNPT